jgi:tetratricopeptide (TPR) repeat protein
MGALAKAYCAAGHHDEALALISRLSMMLGPEPEDPAQLRTLKAASVGRLMEAQLYCGQLDAILKAEDLSRRPTELVRVAARFASGGSYERAHEVALRIQQPEWRAAALLAIARFKARDGTHKAGEAFAKEAYQVANAELHDNSNPARQFRLVVDFGRTFGELGKQDAALQLLQEANRYADTVAKSGLKVELHHVVVRAYADAGEIEQAITLARLIQDDYARADGLASVVAALLGCRDACT